ncbi:MAG: glycosyltransferase family 2 protein [Bacteroidaceae bacterium]|nr:glycosyltransferase family 2 protein [Bacteroidaceae bacterium]
MRKLAIVILNWNGAKMLRQYLPTVLENSVGDVIVADNASIDGSVSMLLTEFPQVRNIILEQNFGFAEGYNRALAQLSGYEYFLLLNSDVEIRQQRWDEPMIRYMDAHPECAACQPKLLSLLEPDCFEYAGGAGGYMDKYGYPFCRGRVLGTIERDEGQYDDIIPLMWATGAALMVRASDWRESGGLDARFFAHMEEIDLCWRLRTMGKSIVCVSDSVAYHLGGATLNQGNPRKTFLNFRNNLLMLYKNLPDDELKHVMRVRTVLDFIAAIQFLVKLDFQNFMAVFRARKEFGEIKNDYDRDRRHVQQLRVNERVPQRMEFLLLWEYYAKGKHTFKELVE